MTALIGFGIDSSETILNGNDKRAPVGTLFIWYTVRGSNPYSLYVH